MTTNTRTFYGFGMALVVGSAMLSDDDAGDGSIAPEIGVYRRHEDGVFVQLKPRLDGVGDESDETDDGDWSDDPSRRDAESPAPEFSVPADRYAQMASAYRVRDDRAWNDREAEIRRRLNNQRRREPMTCYFTTNGQAMRGANDSRRAITEWRDGHSRTNGTRELSWLANQPATKTATVTPATVRQMSAKELRAYAITQGVDAATVKAADIKVLRDAVAAALTAYLAPAGREQPKRHTGRIVRVVG